MIAQSLGQRGIEIIGCDSVDLTVLSFSKFVKETHVYTPFQDDEEGFIDDLLRIIKDNKPESGEPYILMPSFNDAKIISKHKDKFPEYIKVTVPDYEIISRISPKDNFAKTAKKFGIASPITCVIESKEDIKNMQSELSYPVFIKPVDEAGGRGISEIDDKTQIKEACHDLMEQYPGEDILVQAKAEGKEYCFCGLFDHGEMLCSMVYHNLRKFPYESGPGVMRETVESGRFDKIAQKLMKKINWHGVVEIDFMWDEKENNTPLIIEVNPRFWTGLDHSVNSNLDFPWMLYQLFAYGQAKDLGEADIGFKSNLQGITTLSRMERFFEEAVDFEKIQKEWPSIWDHLKDNNYTEALQGIKDALGETISLDQAYDTYKTMQKEEAKTETLTYGDDDPYIGLGFLYILGSLVRHGELPPEMMH